MSTLLRWLFRALTLGAVAAGASVLGAVAKDQGGGVSRDSVRGLHADQAPVGLAPAAVDSIVALAPFRSDRRPAVRGYDARPQDGAPPPTPRPQLLLRGILWGDDPMVLIDGVPGEPIQRVLHRGDTVAGLRVRTITRDRVVITGMDTTWSLRLVDSLAREERDS